MEEKYLEIEKAISRIRLGGYVIVTDDKARENEGDLILAAEMMTPEKMSFLLQHTSGVVCVSLSGDRLDALKLPLMVAENTESKQTAFTISVDAREGTSTGISAADRAKTVADLADPTKKPEDFRRPGHIFPLRVKEGGVLKRAGHTEAAYDLPMLAGLQPVGVLCEIVNPDGSMARMPELKAFSEAHDIPLISIADLIAYRHTHEKLVRLIASAQMPTSYGYFTAYAYESLIDGVEHMALVKGDIRGKENILVRVHSECLTGDLFGSKRCDCGAQLERSLELMEQEGSGVLVYLRGQEGRGIGLGHKLRAYHLQESGLDTVEANVKLGLPIDSREYGIGSQILAHLGVTSMRLLTNNPAKYNGLKGYGLSIAERIPLMSVPTPENIGYLFTKKTKLGHHFEGLLKESADHASL